MKLGLITDVHEQVELLRVALKQFATDRVDQVVVIGDVFELGERIEETCRLLAEARAVGVWGNHDFGLCNADDAIRARYPVSVVDYMTSLRPRLEIESCHFSHVEPWLNPEDVADLWYFEGPPDKHRKLERIFNAVPHRVMFAGHFHKWLLATPDALSAWHGERPVHLREPTRYFAVVGALCDGRFAVYETESGYLVPFNCSPSG